MVRGTDGGSPGFRIAGRSSVILGMLASRDPSEREEKMRRPQRNRRLQFEVMESREALSASLAGASLAPPVWVGPPPPEQLRSPRRGRLAVSLTTDHSVYHRGQPVVITLTETNISSHDSGGVRPEHRRASPSHTTGPLSGFRNKGPVPLYLSRGDPQTRPVVHAAGGLGRKVERGAAHGADRGVRGPQCADPERPDGHVHHPSQVGPLADDSGFNARGRATRKTGFQGLTE